MFLFLCSNNLFAQAHDTLWTKTFGGELADAMVSVKQTSDGGFVFGGWTHSFSKGSEDVWVIRTDADGDTLWTRVFGGERYDSGHSIDVVSTGGSIVAGQTYSFGHLNKADFWLIRLDDNGDTLWTRTIGGNQHDYAEYVTETRDGGFIVTGGTSSFGNGESDVWLVRLDSFGDTLWTRTYGGEETDWAESVHETSDGGFILSGSTHRNGDRYGWLIRTDNKGDSLWTKIFGDTLIDSFHPVKELSNGDFIIGGFSEKPGKKGDEAWLVRTDDSGNLLWEKTYGGNGGDRVYDIEETNDGGFIVLAWTRSFGSGEHDIWLLRTDANGDSLWSKFYGGELSDVAFSFHRTHDNGFILSGYTKSYSINKGISDAWLLKITPSLPVSVIITESDWTDIDRDGYSEGPLDGTKSFNLEYEIISYSWTMNDSVIGTTALITASLPVGTNRVKLVTTDENGYSDSTTKDITVVPGALPTPVITTESEWKDIDDDGYAEGNLDASSSTHPAGYTNTGFEWSLNDSIFGTAVQITASLPRGTNTVKLTVTDENGLVNSIIKDIIVVLSKLPVPVISAVDLWIDKDENGYSEGTLDGTGSSHPAGFNIISYVWKFSGITIGTQSTVNATLPTGTSRVYLAVTDENGLVDSTSIDINVHGQKLQTDGPIASAVSSIGDSLFFASSADDKIYHFGNDGIVRWFLKVGGDIQSTTTIGPNNRIYVGSSDTRLYSFNLNGNIEWDIAMGGVVTASPAVTSSDILYVGVDNGRLFSLNGMDGSINWNYLTGGPINSSASVGTDGTIYVGSDDGRLYALNPDGTLKWNFTTGGPVSSSPALDLNGNIYFGSDDHIFYSLDSDGNENWQFPTGGSIQSSPVIGGDGTVYFGTADSLIYAVSSFGELVWSYDAGSPVNGSPTLLPDGKLAIGTDDGRLLILSSIGKLAWYYQTDSSIIVPPLVTDRGMIYVGSADGSIYGLVDPDLASLNLGKITSGAVWPTFQGNNQRTGFQGDVVAVEEEPSTLPTEYSLSDNYPNPFNPRTTISYALPRQSDVTLIIFNLMGQEIMRWDEQSVQPGFYSKTWNGTNKFGVPVGSGIYLYRLVADGFVDTRKMILLK